MLSPTERYALSLMLVILMGIVGLAYWGNTVVGGSLEGTDAIVEEHAAAIGDKEPTNPIQLSEEGEVIAFTLAAVLAGLLIGYLWPSVFEEETI